jgi:flagellar basal-body rod protein FlgF
METEVIAYARQRSLFQRLEVVANNVANANSNGFKKDLNLYLRNDQNVSDEISTIPDTATVTSLTAGEFTPTQRPLDVAINGKGFFRVETPLGTRYTRDGSFSIDTEGNLVTKEGYLVQGDGGAITLTAEDDNIEIGDNGEIYTTTSNGRQQRGTIAVANFTDESVLQKAGNNYFQSEVEPEAEANPELFKLVQGMVEKSNVNSVMEITELIDITRSVEQVAKIISDQHSIARNTFNKIAGTGN